MNAPIRHADAFHKLIHENHMYGLWEIASQMTPQPQPEAIPHLWKWSLLERVVEESCTAVPVGDERRAMQLFNPGLNGAWATTNTLIAAVQVLPAVQAWATEPTWPWAKVWPAPSEKVVAEIWRFQPAPVPRASTIPSSGA